MKHKLAGSISSIMLSVTSISLSGQSTKPTNLLFVLTDEWRAQDVGYNGNKDVVTPNLDLLASRSINFTNMISGCPVSSPYRASLLTGQYPLTTGIFVNDVQLNPESLTLGKVFKSAGYQTAYIGKWHLDGNGRSSCIPIERRQGFEYWKVLECTHDYYQSFYWGNDNKKRMWEGYDAYAQTADAIGYMEEMNLKGNPFFMILSLGPPHTPFESAPESFKSIFRNKKLQLRANVPSNMNDAAIEDLIGYYGHIAALDSCIGMLYSFLKESGLEKNTIFIFTSDHGAMVKSHGFNHKQRPYEESINVPLLVHYPIFFGDKGRKKNMLISVPDVMPTLLGLCNLPIPSTVEGEDKSMIMKGKKKDTTDAVLIASYHAFGQWSRSAGGKEYRGVRTKRYTYVKDLSGPWLLFDNQKDPFQLNNVVDDIKMLSVRNNLEKELERLLLKTNDQFYPGMVYIKKWNYKVNETGTVPYKK